MHPDDQKALAQKIEAVLRPVLFEAALAAYPDTIRSEVADVARQALEATLNRVEQEAH